MIDDQDRHAVIADEVEETPAPNGVDEHVEQEAPAVTPFAKIVLKRSGAETDIEFPLSSPSVLGRFDPDKGPIEVDLGHLPEASYISRKHARFDYTESGWSVTDLGSSNGTFVLRNDFERVEMATLEDGTEISFGNVRFVFKLV